MEKYYDFALIKQRYGENPLPILRQLVGNGEIQGKSYVALNPTRNDRHIGSFFIDIATGRFYDFATGDKGGDVIDLAAYIYNCGIGEAVQRLGNFGISGINTDFRSKKFTLKPFKFQRALEMPALPEEKSINLNCVWRKSTVADHPYLRKKKISIGNARVNFYKGKSQLVIPLTDTIPVADKASDKSVSDKSEDFQIKGLQFIYEDGQKRFMGSIKGLFHIASDFNAGSPCGQYSEKSSDTKVCGEITIILAEGYATARSIAQALDTKSIPADRSTFNTASRYNLVLAAMSSSNMKNVAEKIAKQFPNAEIIIAADNDEAGRKAATEAQKAISGKVSCAAIYPSPEFNDFNDMYQAVGAEGIRKYFSILDKGNEENE